MLHKAKERLGDNPGVQYLNADFAGLLNGAASLGEFDLCVSAMAIHHLFFEEKATLFQYIHDRLAEGGSFLNIDVVLSPSMDLESWYFEIWRKWMSIRMEESGVDDSPEKVIMQYKDPSSMNKPDTLEAQLTVLRDAVFHDVDCFFKSGIFAVFGGKKSKRRYDGA
jgi:tRNA (cmo5U34)-methyltransferase